MHYLYFYVINISKVYDLKNVFTPLFLTILALFLFFHFEIHCTFFGKVTLNFSHLILLYFKPFKLYFICRWFNLRFDQAIILKLLGLHPEVDGKLIFHSYYQWVNLVMILQVVMCLQLVRFWVVFCLYFLLGSKFSM